MVSVEAVEKRVLKAVVVGKIAPIGRMRRMAVLLKC